MCLNKEARADLAAGGGVFLDTFNSKTFFLDDAWVSNSHLSLYKMPPVRWATEPSWQEVVFRGMARPLEGSKYYSARILPNTSSCHCLGPFAA